jgi:hypothetical protein
MQEAYNRPTVVRSLSSATTGGPIQGPRPTRHVTAHSPTVPLSTTVTGQSAVGIGTAVGMAIGGPTVIAATDARKQRSNRQSDSGPTCRLASSPEAGPGATVGTLNQGYPLLQHKGIAPMR